jgi:signal transduction histidine kinase
MQNNDTPLRILLIDDERMNADMLEGMLGDEPATAIDFLSDPGEALLAAQAFAPSVILVDLRMPGRDGFEVIRTLKRDPRSAQVPVLMLSSEVNPHVKASGFAAGAADYLVKWPDRIELLARVRAHSNGYYAARERDRAMRALEESQRALLRRTEELARAQSSLHEAQKMEAIGKLTSSVAHDFNNVLQLINGHLQLMRMESRDDKSARRIDAASEGVRRGARLASQLLAVARKQPLQNSTVDLAAFLRGIEATVLNAGEAAPPCQLRLADGAHPVALDPLQMESVLAALLANAREAMPVRGSLSVVLDSQSVTGLDGPLAPGEYVRLRVIDSGAGMEPEVLRRAFEPFFTTKAGERSAGLGLALAFGFVKQSGGHIALDSQPGQGTTVTLYFPRKA